MQKENSYKIVFIKDFHKQDLNEWLCNSTNISNDLESFKEQFFKSIKRYCELEHQAAELKSSSFSLNNGRDFFVTYKTSFDFRRITCDCLKNSCNNYFFDLNIHGEERQPRGSYIKQALVSEKPKVAASTPYYINDIHFPAIGKSVLPFLPGCDDVRPPDDDLITNNHQAPSPYIICPIYKKNSIRRNFTTPTQANLEKILIGSIGGSTFFYYLLEKAKAEENPNLSPFLCSSIIQRSVIGLVDEFYSTYTICIIKDLLSSLKKLIVKAQKKIKSLRRKTAKFFWRDLRTLYRKIIRFLFKNLGDNSDCDDHFVCLPGKHCIILQKEILYETENRFNQSIKPCYQFQIE